MSKSIEEIVYQYMCVGCKYEHYCHNACETCEEYEDEVDRLHNKNEKL